MPNHLASYKLFLKPNLFQKCHSLWLYLQKFWKDFLYFGVWIHQRVSNSPKSIKLGKWGNQSQCLGVQTPKNRKSYSNPGSDITLKVMKRMNAWPPCSYSVISVSSPSSQQIFKAWLRENSLYCSNPHKKKWKNLKETILKMLCLQWG